MLGGHPPDVDRGERFGNIGRLKVHPERDDPTFPGEIIEYPLRRPKALPLVFTFLYIEEVDVNTRRTGSG